jgi:virginiamycin B lyase
VASVVPRLDPATAVTLATLRLSASSSSAPGGSIAVGPQGIWVVNPDSSVSRIDPATAQVLQTVRDVNASQVATGPAGTWALEGNTIARLSPDSDRIVQRVSVAAGAPFGPGLASIAVGDGAVWATDPFAGTLQRIDLSPVVAERTIPLVVGADDIAYGAGAVCVSNGLTGTVSRIDPPTNLVTRTTLVGNAPGALAIGNGGVWVAVGGAPGASVPAASESQAGVVALPRSICGPVLSGGGRPQLLIVSDLPLHGELRRCR